MTPLKHQIQVRCAGAGLAPRAARAHTLTTPWHQARLTGKKSPVTLLTAAQIVALLARSYRHSQRTTAMVNQASEPLTANDLHPRYQPLVDPWILNP